MQRSFDKAFFPYPVEQFSPECLYGNVTAIEPVYVAVPCLAYRVCIRSKVFKRNVFEQAIITLSELGLEPQEIAERLCMQGALIRAVLNNYKDRVGVDEETKEEITLREGYIFKNTINGEYVGGIAYPDYYKEHTAFSLNISKDRRLVLKDGLAETKKLECYILPNSPQENSFPLPNETEILRQAGDIRTSKVNSKTGQVSITQATCLGEGEPVYLVCPCYITFYTRTDYDVMNPVRRSISTDIKLLIEFALEQDRLRCEKENKENPNSNKKSSPLKGELDYLKSEALRSAKISVSRRQEKAATSLFREFDRKGFDARLSPFRKDLFDHLLDAEEDFLLAEEADCSRSKDFAMNANNFLTRCFLALEDVMTCSYTEAVRSDDLDYFDRLFPREITPSEEKNNLASCLEFCNLLHDDQMTQFVQKTSIRAIRNAIERVQNEEYEKISNKYFIGVVVNAFLSSKGRGRVARFDILGKNRPALLHQLNYFAEKANSVSHGGAQDIQAVVSLEECKALRSLTHDAVHMLLGIGKGDRAPVKLGLQNIEAYIPEVALKVAQEKLGDPTSYGDTYSYLLEIVSGWHAKAKDIYSDIYSFYAHILEGIVEKSGLSKNELEREKRRIGSSGIGSLTAANNLLERTGFSDGQRISYPNIRPLRSDVPITTAWWLIIAVNMLGKNEQSLERFLSDFPGIIKNIMDCKSERGHRQSALPDNPIFRDESSIKLLAQYAKAETAFPEGWYQKEKE